jgi:transcription antitermination factor NusG
LSAIPTTSDLLSINLAVLPVHMSWFAVQTRPRFEKKVALALQEKGLESYVPLFAVKHQWSDRKQTVSLPLFPGYAFVRIALVQDVRVAVLRTNGVLNFVGARGIGTAVPDSEIHAVRALLKEQIPLMPHPFLKVGQVVRIRGGALGGIQGILTKVNGDQSLIISVELIQRSIAMRVSGFQIEAA